ncbi:hypothetical protein QIP53_gp3 [ssRNA phage Gerhypos.4_52]|uniref:Uncharacterized protein n=2 Tax=Leviviricetes TaxID=2842243 RepID=A0A8S5KYU5_9VIRU|nr:hypothetical protein QIP53_gp3 [ssRNA phage Gerhypos.4_52]QDH88818.1 MAG: hypothetical protein H4Bulk47183_000003 [Leviviridae sp.]DAD50593.1 TPA_asm: hypothetical protein [ssRNA phage Gerhypos.4_52]
MVTIMRDTGPGVKPVRYRIMVTPPGMARPVKVIKSSDPDEILSNLIQILGLRWPYQKPSERQST